MTRKASFSIPPVWTSGRSAGRTSGRIALAAGLTLGLGFATPSLAVSKGGFGGPSLERAIDRLELDEAQRAEVFSVIDAARPACRDLRAQIRAAHQELRTMLADPRVDEAIVLAQADAIGALRTELSKHRLSTLIQVREQLSPEQQEKLADAMKKRHGRRHGQHRHVL